MTWCWLLCFCLLWRLNITVKWRVSKHNLIKVLIRISIIRLVSSISSISLVILISFHVLPKYQLILSANGNSCFTWAKFSVTPTSNKSSQRYVIKKDDLTKWKLSIKILKFLLIFNSESFYILSNWEEGLERAHIYIASVYFNFLN